jgi:ubiquinone/menaquinone biosynthesis C-methylase UbiE
MAGKDSYIKKFLVFHPVRESMLRSAIDVLSFPAGSRGLDAGCGIGLPALLLAERVGPAGHVTGLDVDSGLLAYAERLAGESQFQGRISFRQGSVDNVPFDDGAFDWAWSIDCVGYAPGDPTTAVGELARVTKPGGTVAIMMWSYQQMLPGYPRLEARLNATSAGTAPFTEGMKRERHYMRALGWLARVGLKDVRARTIVGDVHAPLSDAVCDALVCLFEMRWENVQPDMAREDWEQYQRLIEPTSPDFILNCPDYYAFFTYSLFYGKVSK